MIRTHDLRDRLFLASMVAISALPYLAGLGLYSDDYAFLAVMAETRPQGFGDLFGRLSDLPNLRPRPLQSADLAFLYWAFGFAALPAHILNHVVFGAAILLFHAGLRRMGVPRLYAVALPLILASMPHYATVRFWLATSQIPVAMAAFFLSLLLGARYVQDETRRWLWLPAGAAAIVASAMAYETFLPLCLAIPFVVWLPRLLVFDPWPHRAPGWIGAVRPFAWQLLAYGLTTAAMVWAKLVLYGEYRVLEISHSHWLRAMEWLVRGVFHATFIENGVKLPANAATLIRDHWHPGAFFAATGAFAAILAWLLPIARDRPPERRLMLILSVGLLGFLLFLAGYATFANNFNIGFSPTGIGNRTAAAGSIGAAVVALAAVLLAAAAAPRALAQRIVPAAVALGCSVGILVNATLGVLWTQAAREQQAVLAGIRAEIPALSGPTAVLLDGACPFVGPAPVFESSWDLAGALRLIYGDPSIRADVVKPNTRVGAEAIITTHYDVLTEAYPYGPLVVFDLREGKAWPMPDRQAALDYFGRLAPGDSTGCAFEDGAGVSVY